MTPLDVRGQFMVSVLAITILAHTDVSQVLQYFKVEGPSHCSSFWF